MLWTLQEWPRYNSPFYPWRIHSRTFRRYLKPQTNNTDKLWLNHKYPRFWYIYIYICWTTTKFNLEIQSATLTITTMKQNSSSFYGLTCKRKLAQFLRHSLMETIPAYCRTERTEWRYTCRDPPPASAAQVLGCKHMLCPAPMPSPSWKLSPFHFKWNHRKQARASHWHVWKPTSVFLHFRILWSKTEFLNSATVKPWQLTW